MHVALAVLVCFGILTLWVPASWPVTVFQVGIFALASLAVWRARSSFPRVSYPLLPLAFAVAWGLFQCSAGFTAYAFETQKATVYWATLLATFLAAVCLFGDPDTHRSVRSAMLWFGFGVSVLATIQTFTSEGKVLWLFPTEYTADVMGPILSRNHYAAFIEIVLPVALYEALKRDRDALLYSAMAGAMYASVIASGSRAGAALATAEIVAVTVLMWIRGRSTGRAAGGAILRVAVLLGIFTAVVGYEGIGSRLLAPDPMAWRREFAISSLHMIAAHPWFGVGLGTWSTVYPHYAVADFGVYVNQAHNDWLQWTAEGGLPFGLMMATLFFWCLRPAWSSVWGLGIIAVFLHAIVDYPFSRPALGAWIILMMALLASRVTRPNR